MLTIAAGAINLKRETWRRDASRHEVGTLHSKAHARARARRGTPADLRGGDAGDDESSAGRERVRKELLFDSPDTDERAPNLTRETRVRERERGVLKYFGSSSSSSSNRRAYDSRETWAPLFRAALYKTRQRRGTRSVRSALSRRPTWPQSTEPEQTQMSGCATVGSESAKLSPSSTSDSWTTKPRPCGARTARAFLASVALRS